MGRVRIVASAVGLALVGALVGPVGAVGAASPTSAKPAAGSATKPAGKPASRSAVDVLASAPVKTLAAKTAKVSMDMEFSMGVKGKMLEGAMHVDGAVDFSGSRMAMTMDMSDFMKSIAAAAGPQAQKELSKLGDFSYEIRMAQRLMYMRMPKIALSSLGVSKSWLRIDLAMLGADPAVAGKLTGQANGPYDALAYLGGVSSTGLQTVGREKVRGTETTHYSGTIDLHKAFEESAKLRKQFGNVIPDEAAAKQLFATMVIPFEAWIDDAGRLRKQEIPMQLSQQGLTGSMRMTSEYFDFGAAIEVPVPPAADTIDASTVPAIWNELKKGVATAKR